MKCGNCKALFAAGLMSVEVLLQCQHPVRDHHPHTFEDAARMDAINAYGLYARGGSVASTSASLTSEEGLWPGN
jgi:hypothetical protein